jgi:M6 family metalloprotease-like protein
MAGFRLITPSLPFLAALLATACSAGASISEPVAVSGTKRLLVVPVRFPDAAPAASLDDIRRKAAQVGGIVHTASYGKVELAPTVLDWIDLPAPLADYKVSAYNYHVDRARVRRLFADALGAARRRGGPDANTFDATWIVAGVRTMPNQGYGMIAYCANPGMLSGGARMRGAWARLETVSLTGGGRFSAPAVVSAENAHVGHVVHDLLHALGGARDGRRAVPDLYDFDLQSDPGVPHTSPAPFAIHVGPWDLMSEHFIDRSRPPPPPSSFTRLQLGWIAPKQVAEIAPGTIREVALAPLATGRGILAVRIPLSQTRYVLVENRQPVGDDVVLPASGMLVLEVDTTRGEGAGIVRAADANPGVPRLRAAPFRPGAGERRAYVNSPAGIAVMPLRLAGDGTLTVRVTTPDRADGP